MFCVLQMWYKASVEHTACCLEIPPLDCHASLSKISESFRVRTEEIQVFNRCWMHTCNIQQSNVHVATGLSVDVPSLSRIFATVRRLSVVIDVPRELLAEVGVVELGLRVLVVTEHNFGGMPLCRVVDREPTQGSQDLTCDVIALTVL